MSRAPNKAIVILAVISAFCFGAVSEAGTEAAAAAPAAKTYTGERITLDFQNADLHNIIKIIGEVAGKNIVVAGDVVKGKVTLKLVDVPWDQALDTVLATRNLVAEESGGVLTIYDLSTHKALEAERKIQAQAQARQKNAGAASLVKKKFTLKYAPLEKVHAELEKNKSPRGKIEVIGNDIYIEDDPGAVAAMTRRFMRIDRMPDQILLEVRIIEAEAALTDTFGLTWNRGPAAAVTELKNAGFGAGADSGPGSADLVFAYLGQNSQALASELTAAESQGRSLTMSAPRIMAADDQEVSVRLNGSAGRQAGRGGRADAGGGFAEPDMELKIRPRVQEENEQFLALNLELINERPESSAAEAGGPVKIREAETRLMIKSGETIVVGGLAAAGNNLPGLPAGRLPLADWLLPAPSSSAGDLLIFITAHIIPVNI